MKHSFSCIIALTGLIFCLSSCHTAAPRLDYKALAQASVRLGMDIGLTDNHKLYVNAAEWIGTPYRAGGNRNMERTVPAWYPNFIRKPTAYACRAARTAS